MSAAPAEPLTELRRLERVRLSVQVELGRTTMRFREVERLGPGSVVTLDRLAGEPVELRCRGRIIALGEVVVQDDAFAVRVTEIAGQHAKKADRRPNRPRRAGQR